MKVKVCGMREHQNIQELIKTAPDFIGFIFYPISKRYVGDDWPVSHVQQIPETIQKVGVFVNARLDFLEASVHKYQLDWVQLHGNESVDYCTAVKDMDINTIKVFSMDEDFRTQHVHPFKAVSDMFLFDTKTVGYGGSGEKFSWELLASAEVGKPFLLSGGIGPEDIEIVKQFNHPDLIGVDINSRFEVNPGFKNVNQVKTFMKNIKNEI